jgi:hypothetical protein
MSQVKPHSWAVIENHYISLNRHGWGHEKLLELVRHIRSTNISNHLFAYTSLDKLVGSIYDMIEPQKETLEIQFDRSNQKWIFRYFAVPYREPEFARQYDADFGIEKFGNFIKMIRWV